MKNSRSILDRVIRNSELGAQPLPAVPLVEVMGFTRILIENHKCISSYSTQEIIIRVKSGLITVEGLNLHLAHMSSERLIITGSIQKIQLLSGDQ
jgi:sporulation protein YqfC